MLLAAGDVHGLGAVYVKGDLVDYFPPGIIYVFHLFYQLVFRLFSIYVSDTVYCDSYKCPYGYALIHDVNHEECKYGKCEKSKCCDKVCSSYDCPKYYEPVDDSDTTVCKDSKCTKEKCSK